MMRRLFRTYQVGDSQMTAPQTTSPRRTPLYAAHQALSGRLVDFAGWELPVQYQSALDEHHATRQAAGLFDVSHMGEVTFEGPRALEQLQSLVTNDLRACADGQSQYSALLREDGGVIDDVFVYRYSAERLLICVNASNRAKDFAWLKERGEADGCQVTDRSDEYAQIAIQGPKAVGIVQRLTGTALSDIRPYWFRDGEIAGVATIIARTGYTGEDGFELFCAPDQAEKLWSALLEEGRADGLKPAGLGARDSLRLECAFRLYGNDLDETTSPLEAGLGWIVKFDKGEFVGRDALLKQKEAGLTRRLVGFKLTDKGIARHGYAVLDGGEKVGEVTSGTMSPTLKEAIGLAYVPPRLAKEGTALSIDVRGRAVSAQVVKTPFYKRA